MDELTLTFRVLTPLFMGNAHPGEAGLRPPSFKGVLRFWYRAADPRYREWEPRLFGGIGEGSGQSAVLLRLETKTPPATLSWKSLNVERFNEGYGKETKNGLIYLGFPFQMRSGEGELVSAIRPEHEFSIRCLLMPREGLDNQQARRGVVAAWWLLSHLGGLGSRSRRGFGSLELTAWSSRRGGRDEAWPELANLPLLTRLSSDEQARTGLANGLKTITDWFGRWGGKARHPHLGPQFRYKLQNQSGKKWDDLLAAMGLHMQKARLRQGPDYQDVKDHLQGKQIQTAPQRTSFGLPLAFRYSSVRGMAGFHPHDIFRYNTFERHGSLLWLRPLAVGDTLYPLYVRLDGAVPGVDPPAALRGTARPLLPASINAMDSYFATL